MLRLTPNRQDQSARTLLRLLFLLYTPLLASSCQTIPDPWNKGPNWTFVPAPEKIGAMAHSLCGASGGLFMAFGGIEEGRETPLSADMIVYDSLQNTWKVADQETGPSPRNFAALAMMDQTAYIFGGETAEKSATAEAYVYDSAQGFWSELPVPESIVARKQASFTRVGSELVIFGGKGSSSLSNWARFRPGLARWNVHAYPSGMETRVSHVALALDESRLFIWGGFAGHERRGDGYILDLKSATFTPVPDDPAITPRANARALLLGDNVLVWAGASAQGHSASGAIFHPATRQWTPVAAIPDARFRDLHGVEVSAVADKGFLLFGGRFGSNSFNDQLWYYDLSRSEWSLLPANERPPGRMAHCFVRLEPSKYAVFGGIGYKQGTTSLKQFEGIWILDL